MVDESEPIHVLKQQQVERKSSGDFLVRAKDGASSSGANAEALKSLGAALTLKAKKMTDKARKVFLHAIALSPNNPRILNCYGEFVEEVGGSTKIYEPQSLLAYHHLCCVTG